MAKEGKRFEEDFKKSIPHSVLQYRLPDSNKFGFSDQTRFTPKNPCDTLLYLFPNIFWFELKSTGTTSISFEDINSKKNSSKMIKKHQIRGLHGFSEFYGAKCGFILNFREKAQKTKYRANTTYYLPIDKFMMISKQEGKKSINEKDCIDHGILVDCKKLRIRYRYDIKSLLKKLQN